jgi:hypothetical protein
MQIILHFAGPLHNFLQYCSLKIELLIATHFAAAPLLIHTAIPDLHVNLEGRFIFLVMVSVMINLHFCVGRQGDLCRLTHPDN